MPRGNPQSARQLRCGSTATAFFIRNARIAGCSSASAAIKNEEVLQKSALFNVLQQNGSTVRTLLSRERSAIRCAFRDNVHGIQDTLNKKLGEDEINDVEISNLLTQKRSKAHPMEEMVPQTKKQRTVAQESLPLVEMATSDESDNDKQAKDVENYDSGTHMNNTAFEYFSEADDDDHSENNQEQNWQLQKAGANFNLPYPTTADLQRKSAAAITTIATTALQAIIELTAQSQVSKNGAQRENKQPQLPQPSWDRGMLTQSWYNSQR